MSDLEALRDRLRLVAHNWRRPTIADTSLTGSIMHGVRNATLKACADEIDAAIESTMSSDEARRIMDGEITR